MRRIDAAKEVAESLSRARGVTYLPSGGQGGGSNLLGLSDRERRGDGVLGVAREFCFTSFRAGRRFFFSLRGLFQGVARVASAVVASRCCHHSAVYCPAQRSETASPKQFRGCPKLGLKPKAQTSGS